MRIFQISQPLRWIGISSFAALLALQLVRPKIDNPPVTADLQAPPAMKAILRKSCYNCHSNETKLPWYDQIVPMYWMAAYDVKRGREQLNFSEIATYSPADQKEALEESVRQVQLGTMPLPRYTVVHPQARISAAELALLKSSVDLVSSR